MSILEADSPVRIVFASLRGDQNAHSTPSPKVMKITQLSLPVLGLIDSSAVHVWPRSRVARERSAWRLNSAYEKIFAHMVENVMLLMSRVLESEGRLARGGCGLLWGCYFRQQYEAPAMICDALLRPTSPANDSSTPR